MPMIVRPLPEQAMKCVLDISPPWPLLLHLYVVHDAAAELCAGLKMRCPSVEFNTSSVLIGAATHDLGKVMHPTELYSPGRKHLADGERLLLALGLSATLARFARTHGATEGEYPTLAIEDLLVALADRIWNGGRDAGLEEEIAKRVQQTADIEPWDAFNVIDDLTGSVGERSAMRLTWRRNPETVTSK